MTLNFEHEEDRVYFEKIFDELGGLSFFEDLFDFRQPDQKRKEFNSLRKEVFLELLDMYGNECQLKCHKDCSGIAAAVDHLIPLSSNRLNKEIRGIKAGDGKKAPTQSFGSNNMTNFVLACSRCNAFKQNKFPDTRFLSRIFSLRERV